MRFFKNKEYIGVKVEYPLAKNFCNYDVRSIMIKRFSGRPYSVYDYSEYFEFSSEKWSALLSQLQSDAEKYKMEVFTHDDYAYLTPIWLQSKKSQEITA
jgi:hypothetical protein